MKKLIFFFLILIGTLSNSYASKSTSIPTLEKPSIFLIRENSNLVKDSKAVTSTSLELTTTECCQLGVGSATTSSGETIVVTTECCTNNCSLALMCANNRAQTLAEAEAMLREG